MALFDLDAVPGKRPDPPTPVGQVDPKLKVIALNEIKQATDLGWEDQQDEFLFPAGTRPMDGALDHSRAQFETRPLFAPAIDGFISRVKGEGRRDVVVNVPDLLMEQTGMVLSKHKQQPIKCERKGLEGLLRHVPGASSGVGYLTDQIPPYMRAQLFNYHAGRDYRVVSQAMDGAQEIDRGKPHKVKLRLRNGDGKYKLWAVVGKNFPTIDVDEIAVALNENIPGGARGEIKYDGYKASLTATWHFAGDAIGVGQFVRAGVRLSTADDGTGPFSISAVLEQARCINLSVVPQDKNVGRYAHRGVELTLRNKIKAAIVQAQASIKPFVEAWSKIESDKIMDMGDPTKCFTALVEKGYLKIPGVERNDLVSKLVKAWEFDRGQSRASVINAVTRAAHTNTWRSAWAQEALEEQAGQLVYVKQVQLSE